MRNLKKVLSLSLALVMLLGMMVVGAGAATTGVAEKHEDAVGVLGAIKVVSGDGSGNVNPTGNLTRADATLLIVRIKYGLDVATVLSQNRADTQFEDVKSTHYASGAIAYLVDQDIVHGTTATTFTPNGDINDVDFATLVIQTLGINADLGYGSPAARMTRVRLALQENKLDENITLTGKPITREMAFQLMYNALWYSPSGQRAYTVTVGDNTYTFDSSVDAYFFAQSQSGSEKPAVVMKDAEDSLAKTLFNLTKGEKPDGLGHDVKVWKVGKDEVYTSSKPASAATLTIAGADFKIADVKKDYTVDASTEFIYNGVKDERGLATNDDKDSGWWMDKAPGATIEVYISDKTVKKIVAIEPYFTVVEEVKDDSVKLSVKEIGTEATITITKDDPDYKLVKDLAEGDVFMGVYDVTNWVGPTDRSPLKSVYTNVDQIEGKVTAKKVAATNGTANITVAGTKYTLAKEWGYKTSGSASTPALAAEGILYVYNDYAYFFKAAKEEETVSTDYALVVKTAVTEISGEAFAEDDHKVTARVVLSDGTVADYPLAKAKNDEDADIIAGTEQSWPTSGTSVAAIEGQVFSYEIKDGVMTLKTDVKAATAMADDKTPVVSAQVTGYNGETMKDTKANSKKILFNDKTVFVLYSVDGSTVKVNDKITGPAGLGDQSSSGTLDWDVVATGVDATYATANVVFAETSVGTISTDNLVYVINSTKRQELDADGETKNFVYDAYTLAGEKIEVHTKQEGGVNVTADGLFTYTSENVLGAAPSPAPTNVKAAAVITIVGDQIVHNGSAYNKTADTVEVIVASGAKLESDCTAVLVLDGTTNNIATIFVTAAKAS